MRTLFLLGLIYYVAGGFVPPSEPDYTSRVVHLLGARECTWGPSYWCKNLTTSASCHATKHCIQTVWIHQKLPPDYSSVCQTCLEMVKEARDQLLSNETQEEIKEVFEGSCKLLPVKVIAKECCKIADEFIPELVDTLASQMDPQVVCSVAGLCNNERVHQLLFEQQEGPQVISKKLKPRYGSDRCNNCHEVMDIVERKFHNANRDQVLQSFLKVCGEMGSLSDACSNIVVTYFNDIYRHLEENLNSHDFCLMAGECSVIFHSHANVEITPLSRTGVVAIQQDDLPCDLCKQLVKHLQDVLIANTTEDEFHKVLLGICKQTKSFKDECTSIVDEYYPIIYDFIANQLNGSVLCSMIGICPGPASYLDDGAPVVPLLPVETVQNPLLNVHSMIPTGRVGINQGGSSVQIMNSPELAQLPIERLVPRTLTIIGDTKLCVFCEYFLHYVQKAITDPATEEEIKHVVDKACDELPSSINETCRQFVDTYGPAFVALLAQEIDPSILCSKLSLCPSYEAHNVEVFMNRNKGEKPNCPLCLFAITSLEELIKNKRTEENIRNALGSLCSHLSDNLKEECNDFVQTYTNEIVEACLAQLNPQEVCVYLKLCEDKHPPKATVPKIIDYGGIVATNEIPDQTISGKVFPIKPTNSPQCVLCEFVMSQLEQELKDNATDAEIEKAVHGICNHLPKSIATQCNNFVTQYAEVIIQLLQTLSPSEICAELNLCDQKKKVFDVNDLMPPYETVNSPQCTLCKLVMTQLEKALQGKVTEDEIIKAVHDVCNLLPNQQSKECNDFIDKNGKRIIELLELAVQPGEICSLLFFCATDFNNIKLDVLKCAVCEAAVGIMDKILENPNVDHALEHVLEKTCRALPPNYMATCQNIVDEYGAELFNYLVHSTNPTRVCGNLGLCVKRPHEEHLVGDQKCTWGPSYWCLTEENANNCGSGAIHHCQTVVWKNRAPTS